MRSAIAIMILLFPPGNVFARPQPVLDSEIGVKALNPFYNRITLTTTGDVENASAALYDVHGRQIRVWFNLNFSQYEPIDLNTPEMPAGFYFLNIQSIQINCSLKLVHQ